MINLLPPELKESYHYGRRNHALVRWISVTIACMIVGVALTAGGMVYLNRSINSSTQELAQEKAQLKSLNQAAVQAQVKNISNNLKLATKVLSKEILFSKLLERLGEVTPNNTILTGLSITQTQGGIDITASAKNYAAATQLQTNLADPNNQIFSAADIENIDCTSNTTSTVSAYPCTVTIRALFAKDNPFLFINDNSAKGNT